MICIYANCTLCSVTLILYTYLCNPLIQIMNSILRVFTYLFNPHDHQETGQLEEIPVEMDLPVSHFQDLKKPISSGEATVSSEEEICSICLMEFEKTDVVNKLPMCGHVFHRECMDKWLDRCHFTCPLCRSLVLQTGPSRYKMWSTAYCI